MIERVKLKIRPSSLDGLTDRFDGVLQVRYLDIVESTDERILGIIEISTHLRN